MARRVEDRRALRGGIWNGYFTNPLDAAAETARGWGRRKMTAPQAILDAQAILRNPSAYRDSLIALAARVAASPLAARITATRLQGRPTSAPHLRVIEGEKT